DDFPSKYSSDPVLLQYLELTELAQIGLDSIVGCYHRNKLVGWKTVGNQLLESLRSNPVKSKRESRNVVDSQIVQVGLQNPLKLEHRILKRGGKLVKNQLFGFFKALCDQLPLTKIVHEAAEHVVISQQLVLRSLEANLQVSRHLSSV